MGDASDDHGIDLEHQPKRQDDPTVPLSPGWQQRLEASGFEDVKEDRVAHRTVSRPVN